MKKEISLCCGRRKCPKVIRPEEGEELYTITDDYGGEVKMREKEIILLSELVKNG